MPRATRSKPCSWPFTFPLMARCGLVRREAATFTGVSGEPSEREIVLEAIELRGSQPRLVGASLDPSELGVAAVEVNERPIAADNDFVSRTYRVLLRFEPGLEGATDGRVNLRCAATAEGFAGKQGYADLASIRVHRDVLPPFAVFPERLEVDSNGGKSGERLSLVFRTAEALPVAVECDANLLEIRESSDSEGNGKSFVVTPKRPVTETTEATVRFASRGKSLHVAEVQVVLNP